MRPDEHAAGIAAVLGDVGLEPLNHRGNVLAAIIPLLAGLTLHSDADHVVLRRPAANADVKLSGFQILLLEFVASAARNVNQDRAITATFLRAEDIDEIFRMRAKGHVTS